ncbi:hypothetical protein [Streptomyces violaceus]|uniref:Uncharacterized protein n=1 Tax=Streptomyces violaceus TaxID=1936 RepID=A0ABY9U039_STRVL|nr:hypothetical protein [Streptomyces janthinus]WND15985.1 hypothetical protein RI060_00810 [Streptomyces janthinus]GGT00465.1 hypothetical protein GCM10010270_85320 [Streptomyces janthinus]
MTYADIETLQEEVDQSRILRRTVDYAVGDESIQATSDAYRHAWPRKLNGMLILTLNNWPEMRPDSKVWMSATEANALGDATAGGFMGDAVFTVHNIVPQNGKIQFRLNIAFGQPLPLIVDFWVIHFI